MMLMGRAARASDGPIGPILATTRPLISDIRQVEFWELRGTGTSAQLCKLPTVSGSPIAVGCRSFAWFKNGFGTFGLCPTNGFVRPYTRAGFQFSVASSILSLGGSQSYGFDWSSNGSYFANIGSGGNLGPKVYAYDGSGVSGSDFTEQLNGTDYNGFAARFSRDSSKCLIGNYVGGTNHLNLLESPGSWTEDLNDTPSEGVRSISWFDSRYAALGLAASPWMRLWDTLFMQEETSEFDATPPADGLVRGMAYSPNQLHLATAYENASGSGFRIFAVNSSVGGVSSTARTISSPPSNGDQHHVAWTGDSQYVAVCGPTSPYLLTYYWNGSSFARTTDPDTTPDGAVGSVTFHDNPYQ